MAKSFEAKLVDRCRPLTLDQRCANWFPAWQFRRTATVKSTFLTDNMCVSEVLNLQCQVVEDTTTPADAFAVLCKSCFLQRRSSEPMMRGSKNEEGSMAALESYKMVHSFYNCGMLADSENTSSACSLDCIATCRLEVCTKSFFLVGMRTTMPHGVLITPSVLMAIIAHWLSSKARLRLPNAP